MQSIFATLLLSLLTTTLAAPTATKTGVPAPQPTEPIIVTFNLVSTTVSSPDAVQPALKDDRAIVLFDPYHQSDYLLRLGDNYNLPIFSLSKGSLQVKTENFNGQSEITLTSNKLVPGKPVTLSQKSNGSSGISFNGDLLTVGEYSGFFSVCDGPLGEKVIFYKGTDKSCEKFEGETLGFLQAVPRSEVL